LLPKYTLKNKKYMDAKWYTYLVYVEKKQQRYH